MRPVHTQSVRGSAADEDNTDDVELTVPVPNPFPVKGLAAAEENIDDAVLTEPVDPWHTDG